MRKYFLLPSLLFALLPSLLCAAPPQEKYAIGLFHFNFQYVAGDYKIERRIIRESLFPVLQIFDKHSDTEVTSRCRGMP